MSIESPWAVEKDVGVQVKMVLELLSRYEGKTFAHVSVRGYDGILLRCESTN